METKERITDFSKSKVGDKVFDRFRQEFGIIEDIDGSLVEVGFVDNDNDEFLECYDLKGFIKDTPYKISALVWSEQKPEDDWSILPEMPKRMVKKKVEGWINIAFDGQVYPIIYSTKKDALDYRGPSVYLGEPLFISHEYEEYELEED